MNFIYVNKEPIIWYSKRQNNVETSTYGSEMVAMHLSVEMIKALSIRRRYIPMQLRTSQLMQHHQKEEG